MALKGEWTGLGGPLHRVRRRARRGHAYQPWHAV